MELEPPVKISPKAAEEIQKIMANKSIPDEYGLRIGVKGAGCAGVSYILGFDKKKDHDLAYRVDDIDVYIEKKHTMFLIGLQVDFYEGSDARGFTFVNPEAEKAEQSNA